MNNILNLYSIEFKRIYKFYLALIGLLFIGNISIVGMVLKTAAMNVGASDGFKITTLLKVATAKEYLMYDGLNDIYKFTILSVGFAVLLCLLYGVIIWYRDFLGRSKTGYMLFMLPINKFNIYIAKAVTITFMIYGLTIAQIIFWGIDLKIVETLTNISPETVMNLFINPVSVGLELRLIQFYLIDFIMINIVGVVLAVVVIFTGVMIQKSYKIIGYIIGPLYVGSIIYIYIYNMIGGFTDETLRNHIIYYIIVFIISISISYRLINKKVYV